MLPAAEKVVGAVIQCGRKGGSEDYEAGVEGKRVARGGDAERMESNILLKAGGQHASEKWRGGLGIMVWWREAGKREGLRRSEEEEVNVEGDESVERWSEGGVGGNEPGVEGKWSGRKRG